MASQGESLLKKTQKGISILAFETSKQSRIMKKRMRIAALQKETKADLRDLGNLVYNAVTNQQPGILEEEEVKILVESIQGNKAEVERLRDGIARLSRAKKHFAEEESEQDLGFSESPEEEPTLEERPAALDAAPPAASEAPVEKPQEEEPAAASSAGEDAETAAEAPSEKGKSKA